MLAFAMLALLQAAPGDEAADAALEKFKTDYKSKDAGSRVAAVVELARTPHEKVLARLSALLLADETDVRVAAAKGLGGQTEHRKKAAWALAGGLSPNLVHVPVAVAILEQLADLKEESVAPEVEKHFARTDPLEVQKAAVVACGKIRSAGSVDPLIRLLKELELEAQNATGGGAVKVKGVPGKGGALKNGNAEERDRAAKLLPPVRAALNAVTETTRGDAKDWEAWWNEHRGSFRVER